MSIIKDAIFALFFGVIYYFLVDKLVYTAVENLFEFNKYQKILIIIFVIGLVGLLISLTILQGNRYFGNRPVRYGLMLGSGMLIFYSIISNWTKIDDYTKIIVFAILLASIVWFSYNSSFDTEKTSKSPRKNDSLSNRTNRTNRKNYKNIMEQ